MKLYREICGLPDACAGDFRKIYTTQLAHSSNRVCMITVNISFLSSCNVTDINYGVCHEMMLLIDQ